MFLPYRTSSWLPTLCTDKADLPRLLALLQHEEGWVRLNAAKTIAWLGDTRAIEPLATVLAEAPAEADFGYSHTFKDEEYQDPAPRWREGLIRALGILGADQHTDLIIEILEDERSVLEVRHAAAQALGDLGNEKALTALQRAATNHSFFATRHVARDAFACKWHGLGDVPPVAETSQQLCGSDIRRKGNSPRIQIWRHWFSSREATTFRILWEQLSRPIDGGKRMS